MTTPAPRQSGDRGPDVARIYDSVRSAHLERFAVMEPAWVFFHDTRYDFDDSIRPERVRLRRVSRAGVAVALVRAKLRAIETNEPLMTDRWLDIALQIASVRLAGRLTGRRTRVGAYCIGLTDPVDKLKQRHVPAILARWWSRVVLRLLVAGIDRLAVGTPGTWDLMSGFVGDRAMCRRGRLFPAVPQACTCAHYARHAGEVLFVGALAPRKGVPELLRGWEALDPAAGLHLRIIGTGELAGEVQEWAARRADVSVSIDPPRDVIHAAYRRAHVVVLLSQRFGVWREQVGLPIVEGLAHGCEIITTTETGLASWLSEHGHTVLAPAAGADATGSAIRSAAASQRSVAEVLAPLPAEDPRVTADRWMLGPE